MSLTASKRKKGVFPTKLWNYEKPNYQIQKISSINYYLGLLFHCFDLLALQSSVYQRVKPTSMKINNFIYLVLAFIFSNFLLSILHIYETFIY